MKLGIVRLYIGESGKFGYYNIQEIGLAKSLEKKGVFTDIFFLVDKKENKEVVIKNISEKIRIIYIPAFRFFNHGIKSPKFLLDYKLDIVHLLSDNQLMVKKFVNFFNKNNLPVYCYVGTIKSDSNNKLKRIIMNFISKRNIKVYKKITVMAKTPSTLKQLTEYGVLNTKLIPVGLDLDIIPNINVDKHILRKELGIPNDKEVLIFVGRLEEYKNPKAMVKLFNKLLKVNQKYHLIMIGEGSLKTALIDMCKKYNIMNNIIFLEKVKNVDIHKYYKASDIFLNLNDKEIFGMSILEAMYQECKVIAMAAPGPNYIIKNNINGILLDKFEYDEWINEINKVKENSNIASNAKKRIINDLNWDVITNKYMILFKDLIGELNEKV